MEAHRPQRDGIKNQPFNEIRNNRHKERIERAIKAGQGPVRTTTADRSPLALSSRQVVWYLGQAAPSSTHGAAGALIVLMLWSTTARGFFCAAPN